MFPTGVGTPQNPNNVIRDFRRVLDGTGLNPRDWTPREMRHSFVSLLSDSGVPVEQISRLVGHSSSAVTERVYRKQIRPVIENGAVVMDRLFPDDRPDETPERHSQAVSQADMGQTPSRECEMGPDLGAA